MSIGVYLGAEFEFPEPIRLVGFAGTQHRRAASSEGRQGYHAVGAPAAGDDRHAGFRGRPGSSAADPCRSLPGARAGCRAGRSGGRPPPWPVRPTASGCARRCRAGVGPSMVKAKWPACRDCSARATMCPAPGGFRASSAESVAKVISRLDAGRGAGMRSTVRRAVGRMLRVAPSAWAHQAPATSPASSSPGPSSAPVPQAQPGASAGAAERRTRPTQQRQAQGRVGSACFFLIKPPWDVAACRPSTMFSPRAALERAVRTGSRCRSGGRPGATRRTAAVAALRATAKWTCSMNIAAGRHAGTFERAHQVPGELE